LIERLQNNRIGVLGGGLVEGSDVAQIGGYLKSIWKKPR
jgi:hypothetical protein